MRVSEAAMRVRPEQLWMVLVVSLTVATGTTWGQSLHAVGGRLIQSDGAPSKLYEGAGILGISEGMVRLCQRDGCGFGDLLGKQTGPFFSVLSGKDFREGRAAVSPYGCRDKWEFVDRHAALVIPCRYDHVYSFQEGSAAVRAGVVWRLIGLDGSSLVDRDFQWARPFAGGLASVKLEGKWGYIGRDGSWVIPPQYRGAGSFSEGLAAVQNEEGLWGFIDRQDRLVIDPQFLEVGEFHEGVASARRSLLWGFIRRDGQESIPMRYRRVRDFENGLALFCQRHCGFLNHQGEEVIPERYEWSSNFSPDGVAVVELAKEPSPGQVSTRSPALVDRQGRVLWSRNPPKAP